MWALDGKIGLKCRRKVVLDGKIGLECRQKVGLNGKVGLECRQKVDLDGKVGLEGRKGGPDDGWKDESVWPSAAKSGEAPARLRSPIEKLLRSLSCTKNVRLDCK